MYSCGNIDFSAASLFGQGSSFLSSEYRWDAEFASFGFALPTPFLQMQPVAVAELVSFVLGRSGTCFDLVKFETGSIRLLKVESTPQID